MPLLMSNPKKNGEPLNHMLWKEELAGDDDESIYIMKVLKVCKITCFNKTLGTSKIYSLMAPFHNTNNKHTFNYLIIKNIYKNF